MNNRNLKNGCGAGSIEAVKNNYTLVKSLAGLSSVGLMIFGENGVLEECIGACGFSCPIAAAHGNDKSAVCPKVHLHAGEQSGKFGGKYIYCCHAGFVYVVSIIRTGRNTFRYAALGPVIAESKKLFEPLEFLKNCGVDSPENHQLQYLERLPRMPPEKIVGLSDLLFLAAKTISDTLAPQLDRKKDDSPSSVLEYQNRLGSCVQDVKAKLINECRSYISYPYEKEKQLFFAITTNDLPGARKYLNEILGNIFFSSANDLSIIKVRAMELCIMLSRAALDAGADQSRIFDINVKFLSEFFNYSSLEDVCFALTEILKKFTTETFEFNNVKNIDLISKAVSYIKANYTKKLTLNEVASYVFLSPSYFSKIFKQEMKYYFNDYLNYIRVEKSKLLLLTEQISLVDIADNVGFYDQSYFNKVFKKMTGVTPKKYKESNGKLSVKFSGSK